MKTILKTNKELSRKEAEILYDIFLDNMKTFAEQNKIYASILTEKYREKWISNTLENDINKIVLFYEGDSLIGYIVGEEQEKENFIRDFQIVKAYQKDGHTFKNMIIEGVKCFNLSKEFSGDIWMFNSHSREVFKHIGATFDDGKYRLSYEKLKNWL